jgi:hypothetical protein
MAYPDYDCVKRGEWPYARVEIRPNVYVTCTVGQAIKSYMWMLLLVNELRQETPRKVMLDVAIDGVINYSYPSLRWNAGDGSCAVIQRHLIDELRGAMCPYTRLTHHLTLHLDVMTRFSFHDWPVCDKTYDRDSDDEETSQDDRISLILSIQALVTHCAFFTKLWTCWRLLPHILPADLVKPTLTLGLALPTIALHFHTLYVAPW